MADFSRPAVQIKQGNLTLYLTYVTPRDLFTDADKDGYKFYTVEKFDSSTQEGYQRILNEDRARRLSRHLTEANDEGYAHLPTTVFLATDKSADFDEDTQILRFDKGLVCPLIVVDGQHRIEGLRLAVDNKPELLDFKLPVTLATDLDDTHQMYHFFIVNTTQVPVDTGLRQYITRRFTNMQGVEELPYTPHWLARSIRSGRDAQALKVTEFLNERPESPLCGRIQMANDPNGKNKIRQSSIVNALKAQVFTASNPLSVQETDIDRASRIMLNYFRAVDDTFVKGRDGNVTGVYKSNGIFFFLGISKWIFNVLYSSTNDFTVKSIASVIEAALDEIDDPYRGMVSPDWWMPGPHGASNLNRAAVSAHINAFQHALSRTRSRKPDILL